MKSRFSLLLFHLLFLGLFHSTAAFGQWQTDGVPVCTEVQEQTEPAITPDGEGGVIIVWHDYRSGTDHDIYAQRLNAAGMVQWTTNGVALCAVAGSQLQPTVVSDGAGGAIVAWNDQRAGVDLSDIYAQRVSASGVPQWTSGGVPLCTDSTLQGGVVSVSDGAGGAIVAWKDYGTSSGIYTQRVNAAGVPQWTTDGVILSPYPTGGPVIVSDAAGGAIIGWEDYSAGVSDVYAQRVNATGTPLWTTGGVALCTAFYYQDMLAMVADGTGGAILTWRDQRNGQNIYVRRVDASGAPQWVPDGVALAEEGPFPSRNAPTIASDGAGGAIVAWQDDGGGGLFDILARRVNAAGVPQLEEPVIVCAATSDQVAPTTISDGAGGVIITWQDRRAIASIDDIYAQRLNGSGVSQWMQNGVAVCTAAVDQSTPMIVSDGGGGAVIAWQDRRTAVTTQFDIFALRIGPEGLVPTGVRGASPTPSLIVGNVYPNPFSAATSLDLWLAAPTDVRIELVDVAGHRVREMMLRQVRGGPLRVALDGRDGRGRRLANGVYFCKVTTAGTAVTRKMVIAR